MSGGRIVRSGLAEPSGVQWLDEPGTDEVIVRVSRAVGLPERLPDVLGLALRIPVATDKHADLLLATTGYGRVTRFVLAPARRPDHARFSTLLPYRTPEGPAVVGAVPSATGATLGYELQVAIGVGPWRTFGTLEVPQPGGLRDLEVTFDPMLNTLPGLEPYPWVKRLRESSYRAARRSRGERG